ncbi:Aquaporin AQPcic [Eumeta japonica]|uniref:Aquaporin AQPcic n=1 Tax=Eumeta variegata TaxID=151549 RepID=A0A4C1ZY72_EUMVA|nr:Aquaporin AQPcic [Eumeta japonica]
MDEWINRCERAIGHVSGGHINPAVTAGLAAVGKVKPIRAILYVIVQCAGAAAGSALLRAFTPDTMSGGLGVTALGKSVSPLQGFGVEFFLGFVLIFVVCGVSDSYVKYRTEFKPRICETPAF